MKFDPNLVLKNLHAYGIKSERESSYAEAIANRALGGYGRNCLATSLECFLVGLFDVGRELLPKARIFLETAIEQKEIPRRYGHGGAEAERLHEFALCNWLIDRRHDLQRLKESVRWREIWFSERPGKPYKPDVQLSMIHYLDAEEYTTLIERYEGAGIKKPKSLRHIRGEGTMSYVIARHRLGLEYSADEVTAAIETFFKRNVPIWLGRDGAYPTTARWMKMAFWKPSDDPIATLLRCYDYLPGLAPPEYPPQGVVPAATSA